MSSYFLISYCFPLFGLLTGVFVMTQTNPQQLAYDSETSSKLPALLERAHEILSLIHIFYGYYDRDGYWVADLMPA